MSSCMTKVQARPSFIFSRCCGDPRQDVAGHRTPVDRDRRGRHLVVGERVGEDPPFGSPPPDVLEDHMGGHGLRPGVERTVAAIAVDRAHDLEQGQLRQIIVVGVAAAEQLANGPVDLRPQAVAQRRGDRRHPPRAPPRSGRGRRAHGPGPTPPGRRAEAPAGARWTTYLGFPEPRYMRRVPRPRSEQAAYGLPITEICPHRGQTSQTTRTIDECPLRPRRAAEEYRPGARRRSWQFPSFRGWFRPRAPPGAARRE